MTAPIIPAHTIVKVQCDFCHHIMDCSEHESKNGKKHMCYDCFLKKNPNPDELKNLQVDIPTNHAPDITASEMADSMVEEVFPKIWAHKQEEFKNMTKEEIAKELFDTGVYMGVRAFIEQMKEIEDDSPDKMSRWLD